MEKGVRRWIVDISKWNPSPHSFSIALSALPQHEHHSITRYWCLKEAFVETRLVNEHIFKALKGSNFYILDITQMSEFRADAHPAAAGGKRHDDCMHWCLPGVTDTWNDLFVTKLHIIKNRS